MSELIHCTGDYTPEIFITSYGKIESDHQSGVLMLLSRGFLVFFLFATLPAVTKLQN